MTYAVLSDLHLHNWSIFSKTDPDGVNSRLRASLNEIERAADVLLAAGGREMIIAGDIFHQRGVIDPEVLNPARETFHRVVDKGVHIYAIPGNHDLKSRDTKALSSAVENLNGIDGRGGQFRVFNEATIPQVSLHQFLMVPWEPDTDALLEILKTKASSIGSSAASMDVFIHAGIDGVLPTMPAHGLTAADLSGLGFKRVMAGHYHNHKDLGSGIYSIGALTHQNWGDVGSRAGFLIVDDANVTFHDTQAPKFEDISGLDEVDMELLCDGNFVRFRGPEMTQSDINELRKQLQDWGALGVSIEVPRAASGATARPATTTGKSLEQSVDGFVKASTTIPAHVDRDKVAKRASEVLASARSTSEST